MNGLLQAMDVLGVHVKVDTRELFGVVGGEQRGRTERHSNGRPVSRRALATPQWKWRETEKGNRERTTLTGHDRELRAAPAVCPRPFGGQCVRREQEDTREGAEEAHEANGEERLRLSGCIRNGLPFGTLKR